MVALLHLMSIYCTLCLVKKVHVVSRMDDCTAMFPECWILSQGELAPKHPTEEQAAVLFCWNMLVYQELIDQRIEPVDFYFSIKKQRWGGGGGLSSKYLLLCGDTQSFWHAYSQKLHKDVFQGADQFPSGTWGLSRAHLAENNRSAHRHLAHLLALEIPDFPCCLPAQQVAHKSLESKHAGCFHGWSDEEIAVVAADLDGLPSLKISIAHY